MKMKLLQFVYIILILTSCSNKKNEVLKDPITFSNNIAPIIYNNCVECHYKDGPAPFSLTSYKDVYKRKKMILHVLENNYMPPWPADPTFSQFIDEKEITKKEKESIIQWINQGGLEGDRNINYKPTINKTEEPDLIVHMQEAYEIKGDNKDKFLMMKFPFELPNDTFIKKIEFHPGNNQFVHHINAHLITYEENKKKDIFKGKRVIDTEFFSDSAAFISLDILNDDGTYPVLSRSVCNYLPGSAMNTYPEGIGEIKALKKNIILVNDFHYGPSPIETNDSSYFKIYFSNKPPERSLKEITIGTLGLEDGYVSHDTTFYGIQKIHPKLIINANEKLSCVSKVGVLEDISILTINPHMHLLGKSFKAYAVTQKNDTIPLIQINDWNFRWQYFYTFPKMKKIPKYSEIIVEADFDNTINNVDNPYNPPRKIKEKNWGNGRGSMKTTDEMLQFIITYLPYETGDEYISLETND